MGDRTPPLVLLIDDVDDNSDMYAQFLEFEGYQVATAINGAQGIDKARALSPMVIIMDLSMPVLDGWNATRELKSDDATRHIPIIVLTAHAMKGTAESVASCGADAYLAKPCLPEDLATEVRRQMERTSRLPASSA
ncbi:MAG TPA: response regulator [Methylomirabilota bacterium]|jgi:CheY-like chemotaxis protein|nr:response regulator [Methylomirabilota bacterium]